eukprot:gene9475-biopygen5157
MWSLPRTSSPATRSMALASDQMQITTHTLTAAQLAPTRDGQRTGHTTHRAVRHAPLCFGAVMGGETTTASAPSTQV